MNVASSMTGTAEVKMMMQTGQAGRVSIANFYFRQ
jgi:hypothetical protein